REREQAALLDVRDRDADLVDVADERQRRRAVPRAHAGERRADRVRGHLGEFGRRLAPDARGLLLVTRRARSVQECEQEVGGRHGLRIEAGSPTLEAMTFPTPNWWAWRHERGGSLGA